MQLQIIKITDVPKNHLCCGCGTCAYLSKDKMTMIDSVEHGRRPSMLPGETLTKSESRTLCKMCPGINITQTTSLKNNMYILSLFKDWGPILEIWEGYAVDPELRYQGSSGGVTNAIALSCIETGGMSGALHVKASTNNPIENVTSISRTKKELLSGSGSRYSPASPCEKLDLIEKCARKCVFIGKPCDVIGMNNACKINPRLKDKIGLSIGIFCAGTPCTKATHKLLKKMNVESIKDVKSLRYRGHGWPGMMHAETNNDTKTKDIPYSEAWSEILQKDRQWRCRICADHTGEMADISIGDPWYKPINGSDHGQSLILVRTENGKNILHNAMNKGYVKLVKSSPDALKKSQPHLLKARRSLWGRLLGCRLLLIPVPKYNHMYIFNTWMNHLGFKQKVLSIIGAMRRAIAYRIYNSEK